MRRRRLLLGVVMTMSSSSSPLEMAMRSSMRTFASFRVGVLFRQLSKELHVTRTYENCVRYLVDLSVEEHGWSAEEHGWSVYEHDWSSGLVWCPCSWRKLCRESFLHSPIKPTRKKQHRANLANDMSSSSLLLEMVMCSSILTLSRCRAIVLLRRLKC